MRSQNNISNYIAYTRNYLLHTYFCCHSETRENTSMLISMIFLYVAGVIFIYSRVELSVYIIFRVCCRELTSPISWNHKLSGNMFFFQHLFVKCCLFRFVFHQEHFHKVMRFVSVACKWQYIFFCLRIFQLDTHFMCETYFASSCNLVTKQSKLMKSLLSLIAVHSYKYVKTKLWHWNYRLC